MTIKPQAEILPPTRPGRTYDKPRCEQEVSDLAARYRTHCGRDIRCERRAHYLVGDRKLCKTHAGDAALTILLQNCPPHPPKR